MRRFIIFFVFLFQLSTLDVFGQKILSYDAYVSQVIKFHPISSSIRLANDRAEMAEMYARGRMDPELNSNWNYKQFDGKNYYNLFDAYLKVPTIIGVDVIGGYQYASGTYLNDSDLLPAMGQTFLGLNLPLTQGLINNERQIELRKAKLLKKAAKAEIKSNINNLLFEAVNNYWDWTLHYNKYKVLEKAVDLSKGQFDIIKNSFLQGDIPAIDTLKALLLIQDFELQLYQINIDLQKSKWKVENHLWLNDSIPMAIPDNTAPQYLDSILTIKLDSSELINWISKINEHPDILNYQFQLKGLEFDERFKTMKLLPKAELKYNLLSNNSLNFFEGVGINAVTENYKLGFKFSYPILIRQERADLTLNRLKQKDILFKTRFKSQEIRNKLQTYFFQIESYASQIVRINSIIENYAALVEAERTKFLLGESDLLIVNTREVQYIESIQKKYDLIIKYLEAKTAWTWTTAQFE